MKTADSSNVETLKPKAVPNPAYGVREPTIIDAVSLAGILADGAENPAVFDAIASGESQAAMVFLFTGALKNPRSRDGLLYLLADLWTREVTREEVETPHEDWEYEPRGEKANDREQEWRTMSRKTRKRLVKRIEVAELPFSALMDFGRNIAALPSIEDFLDMVRSLAKDNSGTSTTDSKADTDGRTSE